MCGDFTYGMRSEGAQNKLLFLKYGGPEMDSATFLEQDHMQLGILFQETVDIGRKNRFDGKFSATTGFNVKANSIVIPNERGRERFYPRSLFAS